MTEQPVSAQGSAGAQLKQLLTDRVNQGLGVAAKAAGQQAGAMAQAVRQTGEEMRQQGQESQGKLADRIAQPVQRMSGTLSQANPQLTGDVKQLKPKLSQQAAQLKAQVGNQVKTQTQARVTHAGQGVTALTQGVRQAGEQLRAQGQQTPALVLDAVAEKVEPLGGYLSSADPDQLRSDIAAYGRRARTKLSSAANAVNRKQQAATAKGTQAAKETATRVRSNPALPIVGVLAIGLLAARKRSQPGQPQDQQEPLQALEPPPSVSPAAVVPGAPEPDLENLSRAQLRERAAAAGIATEPDMTRNELIAALRNR